MRPEFTAMDDQEGYSIPAASIGNIDINALARTNPTAAKEIARLEDLMDRGEETKEEFLRLCELLVDVGAFDDSEYLLRRNLEYYAGTALYKRLFGTHKQQEFDSAIDAFKSQFSLDLMLVEEIEFLASKFHSDGCPPRPNDFQLLSQHCEIEIRYIQQDIIEVDIVLLDPDREVFNADECLFMYFVNGVWEIADPADA